MRFKGIYIPNVTPFTSKGEINYDSLENLLESWIKAGVSGLVVNASTGEAPYLNRDEMMQIARFIVDKTDGRIDVISGTGAMGTRETMELTTDAKEAGVDAALVVNPFFYRPSSDEIFQHFSKLLNTVDLPVILYNVPKFTGYSIKPEVVARISEEHSNLVGIKDSSGNPGNMSEVIRLCGERIDCLSGSADMILPTLMLGGKGAIVAVANVIPERCVNLYNAFIRGDMEEAGNYQIIASHVNDILVRRNPQIAAIKAALKQKGYDAGIPRKPLTPLNKEKEDEIKETLREYYKPEG
ncbi:MAG: 4-hydroxy-tetrahydrodipicolinate synthase [Candidatus Bathyarchaeia archaeon]